MSGKPAARLSDPTSCPLPGHGTPPIQAGSPDVLFNSLPAARVGDAAACGQVISGAFSSTVIINGKNASMIGSTLSHGGVIIGGSPNIVIGDSPSSSSFVPPAAMEEPKWLAFNLPYAESYAGLSCTAHFDDGSQRSGQFDEMNTARFDNHPGSQCVKLEINLNASKPEQSVTDTFLSIIEGHAQ